MTRREHWQQTGHTAFSTSLERCLRRGVQHGLHGWHPTESDLCAAAYHCEICHQLIDESPVFTCDPAPSFRKDTNHA